MTNRIATAAFIDALVEQLAGRIVEHIRTASGPTWLAAADAAKHTGVTARTLADARRRGDVAGLRRGRAYVYERAALDAWMRGAVSLPSPAPSNDVDAYAASLAVVRDRRGAR